MRPISVSCAALRLAEQLAGAADLEVVRREHEAGAQLFQRLDGFEALRRHRALSALRGGVEQIGVGAVVRAADAAAQLVQLREAQRSARSIMMVLAVGTSMPLSMMVVHTSRLKRR